MPSGIKLLISLTILLESLHGQVAHEGDGDENVKTSSRRDRRRT